MNNLDYSLYSKRRKENFLYLNTKLKDINILDISENSLPLCYPLMLDIDVSKLKIQLIKNKIYVATYWNDAICRVGINSFENKLILNTIYIPLDQRYDISIMNKIVKIIKDIYDEK